MLFHLQETFERVLPKLGSKEAARIASSLRKHPYKVTSRLLNIIERQSSLPLPRLADQKCNVLSIC